MKKIILSIFLLGLVAALSAGQKYNPHEGRWENVPNDWETKYNPHEGKWSYQPKDAKIEYNPHEGSWDWNSGHNDRDDDDDDDE